MGKFVIFEKVRLNSGRNCAHPGQHWVLKLVGMYPLPSTTQKSSFPIYETNTRCGNACFVCLLIWGKLINLIRSKIFITTTLKQKSLIFIFKFSPLHDIKDYIVGWNPRKRNMKSAKEWCQILELEKTCSTSYPFTHSLFIMYLYQEAINVLLKYKH